MPRTLTIASKTISDDSDCYVIAEIGHNHQGNLDKARELFRAARDAGVDAVKLQKRDNRRLYTKAMYDKPYDHENSFGDDVRRPPRGARVRQEGIRGADGLRQGARRDHVLYALRHPERRLLG